MEKGRHYRHYSLTRRAQISIVVWFSIRAQFVDIEGVTGSIPVASTILPQHIASVEETALGRSKTPVCYTSLLHQQHLERLKNSSGTTASADTDCYTNLLHQPSKRSSSPSPRTTHRRRANPPGLIVRGRVFHLRVKVPRKLQATLGRTQVWRSPKSRRFAFPLQVNVQITTAPPAAEKGASRRTVSTEM